MKTFQRTGIAALIVASVAMFGSINKTTAPPAHAGQSCDDSMVNGVYTALWTTLAVNHPQSQPRKIDAFTPSSINSISFFDGSGHVSAMGWTSFGGTYGKFSFRGRYNVNADCTGHLAFSQQGLSYDFIVVQHGDVLNAIDATGTSAVIQVVRQHD